MKKHMFNVRKDSYNDYAPSNLLNVSTDAKNKMPNITAKDTINRGIMYENKSFRSFNSANFY